MTNRVLHSCVLMLVLSGLEGCGQEVKEQMPASQQESKEVPGQMLAGKKLKKANLKGANFRSAMLAGSDLRQTNLENADLRHAMLLGANLSEANLMNADFEEAMLMGAQLEDARIDGVNFKNVGFLTQEQLDEACGKPKALPEGLKAPTRADCKERHTSE
jgi:hypothetical protein